MPLLHEPDVSLEDVRLRSLSISSLELDVAIRVKNRNPLGVIVQEVPFKVLCQDGSTSRQIAAGNTGRVTISANDGTLITVPVRSENAALIGALAAFVMKGAVLVTIRGTAVIDAVLFGWSVPFEKTVPVTMEQVADSLAKK
ncbi:MAG TPA: LEA type 2 family protein [Methanoregula sp.]|nr:LEA type 2 family protein [Methanoregula sp.]